MSEIIKLRSTIRPELMWSALLRGTLFATVGALLLIYGGTTLPKNSLIGWGIPLVLVSLMLIAFGLIPYRRLSRLQVNPDEIHIKETSFCFISKKKMCFTVPFASIEKIELLERRALYGIGVQLKHNPSEKISVHDPRFDMQRYQACSQKRFDCDLFFPYFTSHAVEELKEVFEGEGDPNPD
jgi:hypothetical protein